MTEVSSIAENITMVRGRIAEACSRVNRDPAEVTLVAVSKQKPVEAILEALTAGVQHFGENRVEEADDKIMLVSQSAPLVPTWHMIGHLQSRKVKAVPPLFNVVHSIDSLRLAEKLARVLANQNRTQDILLQINVSGEASKEGFNGVNWQNDAETLTTLVTALQQIAALDGINVRGLMTMAPIAENAEEVRPIFASLRALRDKLVEETGVPLPELSMGMTDDYLVAIEEGATMVRLGRAIFGERN